jgi:prolyl 4-hydroxylase
MWPAHTTASVTSKARYWTDKLVQERDDVRLTVQAVSAEPKIFIIDDFLSAYEVESIINLARPKLERSLVGSLADGGLRESHVRTSSNTWLRRSSSLLLETVFDRAADVMGVPRTTFAPQANAVEDLQVVYYNKGQKYNAHHDWSVSNDAPHSRFATLLIYLSDMPSETAGGETAFPKAIITSPNEGGEAPNTGIKIRPKRGMAALFYNLLEDGNGDDLSLHAALPVLEGGKWLANLWLWD